MAIARAAIAPSTTATVRNSISRQKSRHDATVDRRDGQGRTPLFHAALTDHAEIVVFLLDRGADADAHDQFGDTPLMVACAKGHAKTAAVLLARGADPSLKDQEGRTAQDRAAPGTEPCQQLSR